MAAPVAPPTIAPTIAPFPPPNAPPKIAPAAPPRIAPPTGSCAAASLTGAAMAMRSRARCSVDDSPPRPPYNLPQPMTDLATRKRFGVVADGHQRALGGLEFVQGLADGPLPLNTMAQTLGSDIVEVAKGRVVAAAEPHAGQRNPAGTVHGGLAATLLDTCMGLAVQSMLDKGFAQTTLEFKISLVRPITPQTGLVRAEGRVISCGRRVGTAEGKLTDKDGRVLAHGTTTCLIFER